MGRFGNVVGTIMVVLRRSWIKAWTTMPCLGSSPKTAQEMGQCVLRRRPMQEALPFIVGGRLWFGWGPPERGGRESGTGKTHRI